MLFVIRYPELILLFCTVPLLAWIIRHSLDSKFVIYLLSIDIIFLLPILTGYTYVIDYAYLLLFYIALSCGYSFVVRRSGKIFSSVVLPCIVLFGILGFVTFIAAMGGSINVEREWEIKGYKVRYQRDQGFSGRPLMTYELYKYGVIPIFIKHVDTKVDDDTTNNCVVKFEYKNLNFDKCQSN